MTPTELRQEIARLRKTLEKSLDQTKTHFGMHMIYMVAYDDLEQLARNAAKSLTDHEDDHK